MQDETTLNVKKQQETASGMSLYFRLLGYVKPSIVYFLLSVFGYILYSSMQPALAALLKYIVDVVSNGTVVEGRMLIPMAILGVFLVRGVGTFLGSYCMAKVANNVVFDLRTSMFNKMVTLPSSYFNNMPSGRLLAKLTYDTERVIDSVTQAIQVILREGLTVVGLLGYMLFINWRLSLLFLFVIPIIGLVVRYASKRFRKLSLKIQNAMGGVTDVASEAIKGHEVIKIFGGNEYETRRFYKAVQENRRSQLKMELTKALNVPIIQFVIAISLSLLIWLALDPAISASMSAGDFVAFIGAAGMLSKPMRQLTSVNSILQKGIAAAQSIFAFLDLDSEKDTGSKTADRLKGDISWKGLTFSYPGMDKDALSDVTLSLPAGKKLALVGRSGSGKSTLANLIPRFYDVNDGCLFIDNENINDYQLDDLRKNIALVNQQVVLFNGTIQENIAYGGLKDASEEEVIEAAKAANAWGFIQELELGLQTLVGENGVLLSGGQRQRLAIARAILKNAPILILDEATSALDTESERAIQQALDTLMENRTTIAIAHRLSTIENSDIIAVVDHGQIVEMGSHSELLAKNGAYAQLHNQQFSDVAE
ncbi:MULTISPECIES: lipid A export permease/ATP-binding protein MsbA [Marinomonas]|jgi:subfamily B ATP-binding cassette protein MsbA|uniref:lipid A export permease/ATP-binding protein MsbA n=1 Tax=Marinomonas TaxID=28253 RepID=UPI001055D47A|nr:lipid A export permease/ATP-binding protein MsbA [Marinomonas sp. KMM3893]